MGLLLIAAVMQGCANTKQEEYITIGALLPLTGVDSDAGLRALNGLQVAKDEINESGGILGKKLDIIALNDRGDEAFVVQQYEALMKKGVSAIIGSSYSVVTLALAQAAEKDGIPIISPTASNPEVTRGRRNVFRAIFTDDYQAEVMAHFAYNSLGARTALVLSNLSYGNFRQTAEVFAESFRVLGGQIRAIESYSSEQGLADILTRYRANPPDAIFCPENYVPAVKLVNTAYNIGLRDTYILGTDAWDGLLAYVVQHETVNNVYYSAPFSFDDNNEQVAAFVRNYFNSFSQMPLSGSATAYTCVYILAQAFTTAGNTNRDDVIAAMKTNELDLITGHIQFDENNNPRTNVYIIQVKDGAYSAYEKLSLQRGQ
jgi:branched-chain amino acid transport system substrate-binding protein